MRLHRTAVSFALAATAFGTAGVFTVIPANATTPPAAHMPTYTCQRWFPKPLIYPPMIRAGDCTASNGAPVAGRIGEPLKIVIPSSPRAPLSSGAETWVCRYGHAHSDEGGVESVVGRACQLDKH